MNLGDEDSQTQAAYAWLARMRASDADDHRAAFDAWRANPQHQAIYDRLMRQYEGAGVLSRSRLAGLRVAPPASGRPGRRALVVAIAATAIVAVGLAGWLGVKHGSLDSPGPASFTTAVGEIRTVALAHSQSLTLDTDTVVSRTQGGDRSALRLERGRARLASTAAPVRLDLGDLQVDVRGGSLDVARTPAGAVEVAALWGDVKVTARRAGAKLQTIRLQPGERLTLTSGVLQGPAPDSGRSRDWPRGLASFDEAPLSEVVALANRYGGPKIRLADPALGRLKVTGTFKVTQTEPLAQALAAAFHLTLVRAPNGEVVLSKATA